MIRIYGCNDDLIEIEGDIYEEFNALFYDDDEKRDLLTFSDGTILAIRFDQDSIWRITPVFKGRARMTHTICTADPASDEYSDQVHLFDEELDEPIQWVAHSVDYARKRR